MAAPLEALLYLCDAGYRRRPSGQVKVGSFSLHMEGYFASRDADVIVSLPPFSDSFQSFPASVHPLSFERVWIVAWQRASMLGYIDYRLSRGCRYAG